LDRTASTVQYCPRPERSLEGSAGKQS